MEGGAELLIIPGILWDLRDAVGRPSVLMTVRLLTVFVRCLESYASVGTERGKKKVGFPSWEGAEAP